MANYSDLIQTINDSIKSNGNQEITGPVLNAVLQAMVSALGEGYQFMGMATPDTNPGTPDEKVFYIATREGSYINFTNDAQPISIVNGISLIILTGGYWSVYTLCEFKTFGVNYFTTWGGQNRRVRELYLNGINDSETYTVEYMRHYVSGAYHENNFVIQDSTGITVCSYIDTLSNPTKGLVRLAEQNNSGISGYAVLDYESDDVNLTPTINNETAGDYELSPTIYAYLKGVDLENQLSDLILRAESDTTNAGTAYNKNLFKVKSGDKIIVTTEDNANYGVIIKVLSDTGSNLQSVAEIYTMVTDKIYDITSDGILNVSVQAANITDVPYTISLYNSAYKINNLSAEFVAYDNSNSGLGAANVQQAIDEVSSKSDVAENIITHDVAQFARDKWQTGSAGQCLYRVADNNYRFAVRVTGEGSINYNASRLKSDFSGPVYNVYSDNDWHEIPLLNDTTYINVTTNVSMAEATIEIKQIGAEWTLSKNTVRVKKYTLSKNGDADFTNIVEAVLKASEDTDSVLFIGNGTYDLIEDFKSYYGDDFFDNYNESSVHGLIIKNNLHILGASNVVIIFDYEGSNKYVNTIFSPFNTGLRGGTLENLKISAKNCRYCVHDERGGSTESYVNRYINCIMEMDNSANPNWGSKQCIGGGLGLNGYIEVVGCIFDSVIETPYAFVSWHNNENANSVSRLFIRNNYFKRQGTFSLLKYGESTLITTAYVCGNYVGSAINIGSSGGDIDNVAITKWNNVGDE